jgi:hypothetical protein
MSTSSTTLGRRIAGLPLQSTYTIPRLPHRLRAAIQRLREHLCSLLGVKASALTDAHVAAFARRACPDGAYMYEHFQGIGYETREALLRWAGEQAGAGEEASR